MQVFVERVSGFLQLAHAQNRTVTIDQSVERGGGNMGFRPTELWLVGLSSCSVMTLLRYAEQQELQLVDVTVTAEDSVDEQGDIAAIDFRVTFSGSLAAEQKADMLEHVKNNCKVLKTVGPHIKISYREAETSNVQLAGTSCTLEGGNCCG
ncbi:OsmC family peroxiredoxin [Paenibacillus sp. HJL G12]|uniref:OsmC family peroxiredoxin n=1 Tax=Paenibacillus dendrobii TaxID=2691084 RepID=A0A7X3IJS7_9BACL|nr:OsmC family protein [Paenibacillus dendrobii]MWV43905.1 OsmC family peroxiredoxin [Paenibacillus dendrobii]